MIKIKNFLNKLQLRNCSNCDNVIEAITTEDILCSPLMRNNYKCGISIKCDIGELVFINMAYLNIDKLYIEDDRIDHNSDIDNLSIDFINYDVKPKIIPKDTLILEITLANEYDNSKKTYPYILLQVGNLCVSTNNQKQGIYKYECKQNDNKKSILELNLNISPV